MFGLLEANRIFQVSKRKQCLFGVSAHVDSMGFKVTTANWKTSLQGEAGAGAGRAVIPRNPTVPLSPELFYTQGCGSGNTTANRTKASLQTFSFHPRGVGLFCETLSWDSCAEQEGGGSSKEVGKCCSLTMEGAETVGSCLGEANVEPSTTVPFSLALAHDPRHRDGLSGD